MNLLLSVRSPRSLFREMKVENTLLDISILKDFHSVSFAMKIDFQKDFVVGIELQCSQGHTVSAGQCTAEFVSIITVLHLISIHLDRFVNFQPSWWCSESGTQPSPSSSNYKAAICTMLFATSKQNIVTVLYVQRCLFAVSTRPKLACFQNVGGNWSMWTKLIETWKEHANSTQKVQPVQPGIWTGEILATKTLWCPLFSFISATDDIFLFNLNVFWNWGYLCTAGNWTVLSLYGDSSYPSKATLLSDILLYWIGHSSQET